MKKTTAIKSINEVTWAESNQPTVAEIKTGKDFNLRNYKSSEYTMKVANILAAEGTIVIDKEEYKLNDPSVTEHFKLEQLEYLITKYNKVTGEPARTAREYFNNRDEAKAFFNSPAWKAEKAKHFKLNVLEVLVPTLMVQQEEFLQVQAYREDKAKQQRLNVEMIRARVQREDVLKDLPNQGVSIAIQPAIEGKVKIGEWGPYVTFTGNYESTPAQILEAKIVNAWLYNQEEFRVPSREEQATELEELREWFEQYKYNARRNGITKPNAKTVEKFERLEQLEIEVGTYLNERIAAQRLY